MDPTEPPSDPPTNPPTDPPTATQKLAQARIDAAIQSYERAEAEVDRLCTIIERAAKALTTAREVKRLAQIELDEAGKAMNGGSAPAVEDELRKDVEAMDKVGRDFMPKGSVGSAGGRQGEDPDGADYNEVYSEDDDEEDVSEEADDSEETESYDEEEGGEEEEEAEAPQSTTIKQEEGTDKELDEKKPDPNSDFDLDNESLDQIRYRLQIAKIDPVSEEGTKLLDELLIRFQKSDEPITIDLVNKYIDELLIPEKKGDPPAEENVKKSSSYVSFPKINEDEAVPATAEEATPTTAEKEETAPTNTDTTPPPQAQSTENSKRIRINRGGKVLGWYEGELDSRGYAREGKGSMYYDAGHECHGTWKNDEMVGRGTYKWSDGHVYDGEWENGKRHGLGRFIRPDGVVLYGRYEKGHHRGEGVRWSADRKEAQSMVDGMPKKTVSLAIAEFMALKLGFEDVPPPII